MIKLASSIVFGGIIELSFNRNCQENYIEGVEMFFKVDIRTIYCH